MYEKKESAKSLSLLLTIVLLFAVNSCNGAPPGGDIGNWKNCLRYNENLWNKNIGPEYIEKAFLAARAADPDALLYYNDYNLNNVYKAKAVYNMVSDINKRYPNVEGRPLIDGIGMQSHHHLNTDPQTVDASIKLFASLGVEVSITELDIIANNGGDVNDPRLGQWNDGAAQKQAQIYTAMFGIFKANAQNISRVTFWGLDDGASWRSANHVTLLNSDYSLKPAFYAVANISTGTWDTITPLYEIYKTYFLMGNIIRNAGDFNDSTRKGILTRHYNIVTAENDMKPDYLAPSSRPSDDNWNYSFATADNIVNSAIHAGLRVHGHTLIWHSQTPAWLPSGNKETALNKLEKYVADVAGHYKGRVISWDVVNEAIRDGLTDNDVND